MSWDADVAAKDDASERAVLRPRPLGPYCGPPLAGLSLSGASTVTLPKAPPIFRRAVLSWTPRLMADFGFDELDAAAVLGNAGHESGGLKLMQEVSPRAGRGGLGAFQWTGPRRTQFEAWLKRKGARPDDLDASYALLFRELTGPEKAAVAATKRAGGLRAKVEAFERSFERAGVPAIDSRHRWAQVALGIWREARAPKPAAKAKTAPVPIATPDDDKPQVRTVEPQVAPTRWWERLIGVKPPVTALVGRNRGDEVLFRAQNRLLAAGYTEVGDPDGLWGENTRTAVRLALEEQFPDVDPPADYPLPDAVLAALAKLGRRKVAAERADVTVADLRQRGSTPIKAPVQLAGGGGLLAILGLGKAIQDTGIPERITAVSDQAGEIMGSLQAAIGILGTAFGLAFRFWWLILLGLGLYWIAKGVKWALEIRAIVRQGSIRQTSL